MADFATLYDRLGLAPEVRHLVDAIRNSPPSRNVQGGRANVCARYPSQKMGHTIQAESHTLELVAIYQMEHDSNVLEYYDQPPRFTLRWINSNNRKTGIWHTPDFFVIRRDGICWEEWKREEELKKLSEKHPNRYKQDESGCWRCPPGEEYAAQHGLQYRVRSSREINWAAHDNLVFLEDYLLDSCPSVRPDIAEQIRKLFEGHNCLLLSELLAEPAPVCADAIYTMIARNELICDLGAVRLVEPQRARIFTEAAAAEAHRTFQSSQRAHEKSNPELTVKAGTQLTWDGRLWRTLNLGAHEIALQNDEAKVVRLARSDFERLASDGQIQALKDPSPNENPAEKLLIGASKRDLEVANKKLGLIAPFLGGERVKRSEVSARTLFNYLSEYRAAEHDLGNGYVGLLPKHKLKGRRADRLPDDVRKLINEVITTKYEDLRSQKPWSVYGKYLVIAAKRAIEKVSFKTFLKCIRARPQEEQTRKREGDRAAYQVAEFYWQLEQTTPRHGSRPFEIGHIDHTELEIELVSPKGLNLGRPWLSLFMDAHTRMVLAFYISFEKPSYRACMMVIRECVRRHGRLPQFIVTDRGAEFKGTYFQSLLAYLNRTLKLRPPRMPRFGSVIERMFGISQSQLIHTLRGNTKLTRNVRMLTKLVDPKNLAVWTLSNFVELFEGWLHECYEVNLHPAIGTSPGEAMTAGLRSYGERAFTLIPYDRSFEVMTCPSTPKGRAQIVPGRGIKVNYLNYWNDAFRRTGVAGTKVGVRYDPYNVGVAYAYVGGQWLKCTSERHHVFEGRTVAEVQRASQDILQSRRVVEKGRIPSAMRIAEYLLEAEKREDDLIRLQDEERKASVTRNNPLVAVPTEGALEQQNAAASDARKQPRPRSTPLKHYEEA